MKTIIKRIVLVSIISFVFSGLVLAEFSYKSEKEHPGGNLSPSEAYDMLKKDTAHTFLIDVRTQAEYQFIGHPSIAYNIPFKLWSGKFEGEEYKLAPNTNFSKDLLARFNPKTDKLFFICRSGSRSCDACKAAIDAGWDPKSVASVLGGFEGEKFKNSDSIFNGQRILGGWRNEGLPWSYKLDKKTVYQADMPK